MNTPGLSLFQGAESINVNTSIDRQEEEEEIEDQLRRKEEVCYQVFFLQHSCKYVEILICF